MVPGAIGPGMHISNVGVGGGATGMPSMPFPPQAPLPEADPMSALDAESLQLLDEVSLQFFLERVPTDEQMMERSEVRPLNPKP
jgi:hypothetical protein